MTRQDDATKPVEAAFSTAVLKSGEMLVAAHYWIAASAVPLWNNLKCFKFCYPNAKARIWP